ncbi:MAG TPA: MEDS domain-containing protein [Acidimicrobiales bacterium]|nr:MEDS domain-containing protein [Acidimicrobiales bacterium]
MTAECGLRPGRIRWPAGHLAWFFDGISEFEGAATTFLAEGAARGERLMLVADSPRADLWPRGLVDSGDLIVASTSETYGPGRLVSPEAQRRTFESALKEAVALGYTGLRVASDNTSLTFGPERLAAWISWEEEADRFMTVNPFTGMCAFDRSRAGATALAAVRRLHAVSA